tara:strand:+ start:7442 stop:7636 length:195 start_codon:yes stop_codon:yes gene_type:complete
MIEVNENELDNVFMLRSYVDYLKLKVKMLELENARLLDKILYIQSDTDIYDSNSSSSGSNYSMI